MPCCEVSYAVLCRDAGDGQQAHPDGCAGGHLALDRSCTQRHSTRSRHHAVCELVPCCPSCSRSIGAGPNLHHMQLKVWSCMQPAPMLVVVLGAGACRLCLASAALAPACDRTTNKGACMQLSTMLACLQRCSTVLVPRIRSRLAAASSVSHTHMTTGCVDSRLNQDIT